MGLFSYLNSSIFSKIVMAFTGVLLVLFVLGHMVGNLQVLLGRDVFNTYAHFLQSTGELLWVVRAVLLITLALHIITSIRVKQLSASAKPIGYKVKSYTKSTLASRTMLLSGLMIFFFVAYHLAHFTIGVADPSIYGHIELYGPNLIFERHDAYQMVILGFKNPIVSGLYVVAMILLGFHLNHAIQSMFQTLGFNDPAYFSKIQKASIALSYFIVVGFLSIPISILLGLVGGNL